MDKKIIAPDEWNEYLADFSTRNHGRRARFEAFSRGRVREEDEEAVVLREAVQNLSQKLREVVVMKFWGGLTFLQISETLAISPNTAASRYRYALEQLAHELRRIKEERHASA